MNSLIEKEDFRKLNIFYFLESSHLQAASLTQLKESLNLSTFLVAKSAKELIIDIEDFNMGSFFKVTLENNVVKLRRYGRDSVDRLVWRYLVRSKEFQLLTYLFQNNDFTLEKFAIGHFISTTKTFSLKTHLDDYLEEHNIELTANYQFVSDESNIRIFFYHLFFSAYRNYDFPFSEEIENLVSEIQMKVPLLFKDNSQTQNIKLRYFLSVLFQRLDAGDSVEKTHTDYELASFKQLAPLINQLYQFFSDNTLLAEDEVDNEVYFLIKFLIAEEIISIDWNAFLEKDSSEIALTETFIKLLHQNFPNFDNLETEELLKTKLNAIHYHRSFLNDVVTHYNPFNLVELLVENYTQFYEFSKTFLNAVVKKNLHNVNKEYIFNDLLSQYVYMLIEYFPTEWFIKKTVVTVDFSNGKTYNHFIKDNIKALPFFNVEINYQMTADTDILLSDLVPTNINCDYLIWNRPPLATDWEVFGNLVVANRKNQRRDKHESTL